VNLRAIDPSADDGVARELLAVQRAAYAMEAELVADDRIPPLWESLEELRRAPLAWVGAFRDERLVGAVGWSLEADALDVGRLVVSPAVHRCGVGSALVRQVLAHAGERPTVVSTGRDNLPARALYERLGFEAVSEVEIVPGLWVTNYRHS
jgi:ribosomal protein S18 acetylase RimI-like enzyme